MNTIRFHPSLRQAVLLGRATSLRVPVAGEQLEAIQALAGSDSHLPAADLLVSWGPVQDDDGRIEAPQWRAFDADYPDEGCVGLGSLVGAPNSSFDLQDLDGRRFGTAALVDVSIERIQDITESEAADDAGVTRYTGMLRWVKYIEPISGELYNTARDAFAAHWDRVHGEGSWARNGWVYVMRYRVISVPQGAGSAA